jgi:hypothetical protein
MYLPLWNIINVTHFPNFPICFSVAPQREKMVALCSVCLILGLLQYNGPNSLSSSTHLITRTTENIQQAFILCHTRLRHDPAAGTVAGRV